jgi:hypothetical protein
MSPPPRPGTGREHKGCPFRLTEPQNISIWLWRSVCKLTETGGRGGCWAKVHVTVYMCEWSS